jgi:hypothetical protein
VKGEVLIHATEIKIEVVLEGADGAFLSLATMDTRKD